MGEKSRKAKPPVDESVDECCNLAESIIEEIHLLGLNKEDSKVLSVDARNKGAIRKRIMKQIKTAKLMASWS